MDRVKDKVIVITGAASGLGLADSRVLAREGAQVVMTDIDPDAGQAHANEVGAHFIRQDVSEEASWQHVMSEVESRFGRLDGLVNNAGIAPIANIEDTTTDVWRRVMGIHLDATFWGCQSAIALMKKSGGGSIVNISSTAGFRATPGIAAYGASKGAVRQLTKSVAAYCGRQGYNIRCNSIHPGMVRTPLGEAVLSYYGELEETAKKRTTTVPLGRLGEVEDVANAALFLASDESRYINSTELVIDGGMLGGG